MIAAGDGNPSGGVGPDAVDGAQEAQPLVEDRLDGETGAVRPEAGDPAVGVEKKKSTLPDRNQPGLKSIRARDLIGEIPDILTAVGMNDGYRRPSIEIFVAGGIGQEQIPG